jgi:hypothetical protein
LQTFSKLAWRAPISLQKGRIKPPKTSKACRQGDFCDRQISLIQKTLGKLKTPGLRKGVRRCSHVLQKQASQMARAHSQLVRKFIDGSAVKNAFVDQTQSSADDC